MAAQWRSQDTNNARAQHGHTTYVCTNFCAAVFGGVCGLLPQENFGILQPPRSALRLSCNEFAFFAAVHVVTCALTKFNPVCTRTGGKFNRSGTAVCSLTVKLATRYILMDRLEITAFILLHVECK